MCKEWTSVLLDRLDDRARGMAVTGREGKVR